MAIEIFLLSALRSGPMHGYALRKRVQRPSLREVSNNSLYPTLRRLQEAGAITYVEEPSEEGRPARKVYTITAEGERMLHDLVRELPAALASDDEEFLVRVSFFNELTIEERRQVLEARKSILDPAATQVRGLLVASSHGPDRIWRDRAMEQLLDRIEQEQGWLEALAEQIHE